MCSVQARLSSGERFLISSSRARLVLSRQFFLSVGKTFAKTNSNRFLA